MKANSNVFSPWTRLKSPKLTSTYVPQAPAGKTLPVNATSALLTLNVIQDDKSNSSAVTFGYVDQSETLLEYASIETVYSPACSRVVFNVKDVSADK